uniref:Uncharacterized protein AlNc14C26G2587 n=1 Tax=Albugo laibachii Nc14 TaxID=890382 RepID=F0W6V1_9STRA|nr:conserved hypothetical protein [Albugo laibachii Nc14]|eukprot:CCA16846.1 conserved hypothetical protein [Albugo laibachii Nc14]
MRNQSRVKNAAKIVVVNKTSVINAFSTLETDLSKEEKKAVTADSSKPRKKRKKQHVDVNPDADKRVVQVLSVEKEDELLVAVYWILIKEMQNSQRKCCLIVNTSNSKTFTQSGPRIASILKHLRYSARCIHHKLSVSQRNQITQQFNPSDNSPNPEKLVIVCGKHEAQALDVYGGILIIMGVYVDLGRMKNSRATYLVRVDNAPHITKTIDWEPYYQPCPKPIFSKLMQRIKVAAQITEIARRLVCSAQGEEQWMKKLTRDSELLDDDRTTTEKEKKACSPDQQRMEALSKNLYFLLCDSIENTGTNSKHAKKFAEKASVDSNLKLEITGVATINASVGACLGSQRLQAATQWLDGSPGIDFGGDWSGSTRHGATKCHTSLKIRKRLQNAKNSKKIWLGEWCPNREPAEAEKWGGDYGKVCGHNEIVLHELRPFYPQEVLNSRVCSKRFPAPGNQSFDGCLEYLKLACRKHSQTMTIWDARHFIFIQRDGNVGFLSKRFLIPSFTVEGLKWILQALRSWTVSNQGNVSPCDIYKAIQLCCSLVVTRKYHMEKLGQTCPIQSRLLRESRPIKTIAMFALGGCPSFWNQCVQSRVPDVSR